MRLRNVSAASSASSSTPSTVASKVYFFFVRIDLEHGRTLKI